MELAPAKEGRYQAVAPVKEEGAEAVAAPTPPTIPFKKLFKFRDEKDSLAIGISCVFALLQGSSMPMFTAWFDVHDAAALPTRMAVECAKVVDAIGPKFGLVVVPWASSPGMVAGLVKGWQLSLVIICFLPVMALSALLIAKGARLEAEQSWYARAAPSPRRCSSACAPSPRSRERRERARYEALLDGAARGGTVGGLYAASGFAWLFSAFGLSYAAAFWFSGRYLFRQGDAAVFDGGGDVIEVFFAAIIGVSSVSDAAMPLNVIVGGLAAGANLFGVLGAERHRAGPTGGGAEEAPLAVDELRFDGVRFAYPSRRDVEVLAGVSCAIKRGQKVAFVGESGSASRVDGAVQRAKMAEALEFVDGLPEGFDTAVGQGGGALSGGQKQRERGGMTTLSVSHRLSTVRNADAIFVVSGGVVAEAGTHAELVKREGIYHKLTAAQDAVHEPDAPGSSPEPEALERLESAPRSASDAASGKVRAESSASAAPMNDDDREAAKLKELAELKYEAPMSRIFGEFASKKVKLLFPLALLACCVDGIAMPLQGYVLSEAMTDFYLPYKCPPRCATDDANATDYCWEQTECDKYRPRDTNSPLRREANRNALAFVAIAVLQFVGVFSKMGIYRYIQEQMTAVAGRYLAAP
ncbi:ATPase [Aureococcus anophagefferens]|nr:ATPase [Aureococcus anophagefferens]